MSAMFPPPIAANAAIGWFQVFGFKQGGDLFFAQVRAAQMQALNRYVPYNVLLMTFNVAALVFSLDGTADTNFLLGWGFVMAGLALLWTLVWESTT